jgi:transcriptional regulator with XRE-family HTH domain
MTNAFIRDEWLHPGGNLARRLLEVREATGMTGKQFAEAAGLQPAAVSRFEKGRKTPNPGHIRAWAAAGGLDEADTDQLLALLAEVRARQADNRKRSQYGQAGTQAEFTKLLAGTTHVRAFEVVAVPGFLQVPQYARAIMAEMREMHQAPDDLDRTVQARMERTKFVNDPGKRFEIILGEPVLRWLLCDPDAMRAQLGRLYGLIGMPNVRFGIVPFGVRLATTPQNSFTVYDDAVVAVDLFTRGEEYTGQEVERYTRRGPLSVGPGLAGHRSPPAMIRDARNRNPT